MKERVRNNKTAITEHIVLGGGWGDGHKDKTRPRMGWKVLRA